MKKLQNFRRMLGAGLVLLFCVICFGETKVTNAATYGTCGKDATWKYDVTTKTLTINGVGEMRDYESYEGYNPSEGYTVINTAPWNRYREEIEQVAIGGEITHIGAYSFHGLSNVTEILLPSGVTSIGANAFRGCKSLEELTIPTGVTSIANLTFSGCSSLEKLIIPAGVTSIGTWAFSSCSSLEEIIIPTGVTSIGRNAFEKCSSLTEIIIPDGVTSIETLTFNGCSSLEEITIPTGVTSIDSNAFGGCSSLTEIIIPDGVTSIKSGTFNGCSSLTELKIPNGVTSIGGYAFYNCSSLIEIKIPEGVTSIGTYALKGCSSITELKIPDGVTSIGIGAFSRCTSLTEIALPNELTSIDAVTFFGCSSLKKITIPEGVTSIERWAFEDCSSLTEITIPISVTNIGDSIFSGCSDLKTITLGCKWKSSISGGRFRGATNIGKINYLHQGGEATCDKKAICEVCGVRYGELKPHGERVLKNQFETTCTEDGYTGDICCVDCGTVLETGDAIEAKGHVGGTATCVDRATCEVCGEKYGKADFANHGDTELKNVAEATCTEEGYTGDTCCQDCGAVLEQGKAIEAKGHVGGTATCTEKATCEVCGEKYNEVDNTNHGDTELKNVAEATCTENGYTGDTCCKDCGAVLEQGKAIEAKGHVGGTATCVEKAICDVCGEQYNDVDAANHGEEVLKNQTEVTCVTNGYTGDICCADCGTVLVAGEAVIATGHEYKSEVTKEPTTAENGVRTYTCEKCGDTYTEEIEKLPETVTAEVTYATHWSNGGQVEITLTNKGETLLDGWNVELDLNIDAKLSNSWGDGYVTSFENGHVCITNQSWVTSFEAGATKKVYLQYEGTLPNLVTCVKSDDVLVSRINYLNHWGNGGQIEICLENLGDTLNGSWGTELDINLISTMTNTWGDGYVTAYENGHIVIENQSWVTSFEAGATKSVWLQYDGVLPVYASNAVFK